MKYSLGRGLLTTTSLLRDAHGPDIIRQHTVGIVVRAALQRQAALE